MTHEWPKSKKRCDWCGDDPLYQAYHDTEWGVPCFDSQRLFEKLILEGAQAGLSWITVLKKRERYREQFCGFNASIMTTFTEQDINRLMEDPGLIRNRRKLVSAVNNAKALLALERTQSFSDFIWQFVEHRPQINSVTKPQDIPTQTATSQALSKALKKKGFSFVGPTICYAFMQSMGLVNDHIVGCFRYAELHHMSTN